MHSPGLTVHLIVVARCDRPSQSIVQHAHSCSYYSSVAPTATAKEIRTKYMHLARASAAHPGLPDGIISTHDEDEDDNDADDGGATKLLPHVYSFFGSATQAPADDAEWELPVATPAGHAPSHATALSSIGATSVTTSAPASVGGRGSTRRSRRNAHTPDRGGRGRVVAEAIRRTEATAAARYERALTSVLQTLEPTLAAGEQAQERARRAWVGAGRMWEDPP